MFLLTNFVVQHIITSLLPAENEIPKKVLEIRGWGDGLAVKTTTALAEEKGLKTSTHMS